MDDIDENWIGWNSLDKMKYGSLLMVASGAGTLISQPFYVLTTRQQAGTKLTGDKAMANEIVGGVFQGLKTSIKKIGIRGLFRKYFSRQLLPANQNDMHPRRMASFVIHEYSGKHIIFWCNRIGARDA
jgi:hypothetical protein